MVLIGMGDRRFRLSVMSFKSKLRSWTGKVRVGGTTLKR
jgi:hypothetical protein